MHRLFCCIFFFGVFSLSGQKFDGPYNSLSFSIGSTYVPDALGSDSSVTGIFVESIGLDYERKIFRDIDLGLVLGYELGRYTVSTRYPLNRHNAFSVFSQLTYAIYKTNIGLSVGGGMAFEKHKHLPFLTFAGAYDIHFGQKGWYVSPSVSIDYNRHFEALTLSLDLGKDF